MRTLVVLFALVGLGSLAWMDTPGAAAPALAEKAARWEYAELTYRRTLGGRGANPFNQPGGGPAANQPLQVTAEYKWVTSEGEVDGTSWDDLGTKLKAPAAKKDATAAMRKLQLFNHLGSEGWELIGPEGTGAARTTNTTWLFKRRLP